MNDIICPHCRKAFKIDESGYADILRQVRDREFDKQLHERLEMAEQQKQAALELARSAQSPDRHGLRRQFVQLIEKAQQLSSKPQ